MSSKKKSTDANADERVALVPRLRFPEFRGTEGWESAQLKDALSAISNGLALEQGSNTFGHRVTRIETIATGTIDLDKVGLIQTAEDISAYKLRVGDILLSNINSVAHIGKSILVDHDYDLYHGMNLLRLEVNRSQYDPQFIFYLISTDSIRSSFRERANKAVNQASINQTELGKTEVLLPLLLEQQKIAECLSSADKVIVAQARKVHTLKTHKKGLMQQLFPREGETLPRLRFREFWEDGEWVHKTLGSACHSFSGGTPSTSKPEFFGGDIPFIRSAEIARDSTELSLTREGLANSAAKMVGRGDVLVALYGANSGDVALARIDGAINQAILCMKSTESNEFIFQFLLFKKDWIVATYLQGGQGNLSGEIVKSIAVSFPSCSEQHRIASCMSSLDALITAETHKLDVLKRHKRGLMQQLFPSPVNAEA